MPTEDDDQPPKRRLRDEDRDYDEDDDRPRRRRRRSDYDDEYEARSSEGGMSSLIPYKNGMALASYYCGVFSLILCIAFILGPLAIIFGFLGLSRAKQHPEAKGKAHAITGIVLGSLTTLAVVASIIAVFVLRFFQLR
jgi:hypothetical protein